MVIEIIDDLNHLPENDRKAVIGLVRALARNRRAEDDAAVTAYRRWEAARKAELGFYQNQPENEPFDSNPDLVAAEHAETEAMLELARTVPTTPEGLACQLRFAFRVFGHLRPDRMGTEPDSYEPLGDWDDDRADALMRSMLAGAQLMAGSAANATDELWRDLQRATRAVAEAQTALERHDATLPPEARPDQVCEYIRRGHTLTKPAFEEYARQRGAEAMRLEDALGDAGEHECACERVLVECEAVSLIDVERKLGTLFGYIEEDEWPAIVLRRVQADLRRLAGAQLMAAEIPDR